MQGTTGLDIILVVLFIYISIKLIKRYKKESEGKRWPYTQKNMNLLNGVN